MVDPSVAALLGVVLGVSLKAAVDALAAVARRRRDDRLAMEDRMRPWRLERLTATKVMLIQVLEQMLATARGDIAGANAIAASARGFAEGNIALLGDAGVIEEYQGLMVELRGTIGRGVSADLQKRQALAVVHVMGALEAQIERVLRGEPLLEVSGADWRRLFNPDELALKMRLVDEPPTIVARLAAAVLGWRERRM